MSQRKKIKNFQKPSKCITVGQVWNLTTAAATSTTTQIDQ